jgi:Leucine-rich repeat (LRR) protein
MRRIAERTDRDAIDLGFLGLNADEVAGLRESFVTEDIISLDLSGNQLAVLPEWVGDLTSLDLSDNELTQLPERISDLTELEFLSLNSNRLEVVPERVGAAPTAVSQHLAKLRLAGLVKGRREGTFVYYSAADDHVRGLLNQALFHADHIDRNLADQPDAATVESSAQPA